MSTEPFAANAKLPPGTNAKLPNGADGGITANNPDVKLPKPRLSAAERLRRLEEAIAFLRAHLATGPQPARKLLKAANTAGIAERTLHRAKDLLGVKTERSGGYAGHGQWVWFPPAANDDTVHGAARAIGTLVADSR